MRMTRKRRLRQKTMRALGRSLKETGGKLPFALIPISIVITSLAAGGQPGVTYAVAQDRSSRTSVTVRAMSTDAALRVDAPAGMGSVTVGEPLVLVYRIENISQRSITLSAEVLDIPWLTASPSNTLIQPGDTVEVIVYGTPAEAGSESGQLVIQGFGGFLERALAISFEVTELAKFDPCSAGDLAMPAERVPAAESSEREETDDGDPVESVDPATPAAPVLDADYVPTEDATMLVEPVLSEAEPSAPVDNHAPMIDSDNVPVDDATMPPEPTDRDGEATADPVDQGESEEQADRSSRRSDGCGQAGAPIFQQPEFKPGLPEGAALEGEPPVDGQPVEEPTLEGELEPGETGEQTADPEDGFADSESPADGESDDEDQPGEELTPGDEEPTDEDAPAAPEPEQVQAPDHADGPSEPPNDEDGSR